MSGIGRLFTQTVSVETLTGQGAYGDVFADPRTVQCFVQDRTKWTRDAQGEEVVSTSTIYAPIGASPDTPPTAGQFTPGSRVTLAGRTAYVISVARQDSAGPARIHHTAVELT